MTTAAQSIIDTFRLDAEIEDGCIIHYDDATRSWWSVEVTEAIRAFRSTADAPEGQRYSLWCARCFTATPVAPRGGAEDDQR